MDRKENILPVLLISAGIGGLIVYLLRRQQLYGIYYPEEAKPDQVDWTLIPAEEKPIPVGYVAPPENLPDSVKRWWNLIVKNASKFNLDPYVIASIIWEESKGDPYQQNKDTGARGLMQILPSTAKLLGANYNKLFDPDYNIYYGCKLFKSLLDKYGDTYKALYAYYAGFYPSSKYHIRATNYANRVLSYLEQFV
jgi:soluble lytic murein transglycosylase-like protein